MRSLAQIEALVEREESEGPAPARAGELLRLGEEVLEHWLAAKNKAPTSDKVEGFRLLALHRQGAKSAPSFNACRETCRELVYHYNLISLEPDHADTGKRLILMRHLARHLYYFVSGKMQSEQLGEFCCSSRPLRLNDAL
jgi:hypothetical protein